MHTVVMRVWLPDQPGALGSVATAIGAAGGQVLGIEILEVGAGRVIDELTLGVQNESALDDVVNAVHTIEAVSVEHVRPVSATRTDRGLLALSLCAEVAEAQTEQRLSKLVDATARLTSADWVMVCRDRVALHTFGDAPSADFVGSLLAGSSHLTDRAAAAADDMFWVALPQSGYWLVAGREGRVVHERERVRLDLLVRVADALLASDAQA